MRSPGSTPPSARFARIHLPFQGRLAVTPPKSCPRVRGKCRGVAVTKGEWLKAAKCREMFPLSRLTPTAPPQAVAPLVRFTNSHIKPPSVREVAFAKQKPEGVSLP